jgi:hypothetical protein
VKIVVTGGRCFSDGARIEADLRALLPLGLTRVAQGGNGIDEQFGGGEWPRKVRSADALAWLAAQGLKLDSPTYYPNRDVEKGWVWTGVDGKWPAAGPRRNIRMLEAEQPDLVLAYPDAKSRGTWQCIKAALTRNIIVAVWAPWMTSADVLAMVGRGYGCGAEGPRFVIGLAPIPHALARIALTLDGGAS